MGCKKAQEFLEKNAHEVGAESNASKERRGRQEALKLARSVSQVVVAKGKMVTRFDMKKDPPDDETLLAHLLGPTGRLRAPTLRKGSTLLVGFNQEAYHEVLGT
jgi:arsenate reductase-like glutaredoxin family protein